MKVSILMTTYNHEAFVRDALEGILQQRTRFDFEVVVGDDCSTDGTRAILQEYQRRHPELIRLVFAPANLGLQGNAMFAHVFGQLRGEYVAWLDGDDYWVAEDKLQRQVDFLEANPHCSMCFHSAINLFPDASTAPFFEYAPDKRLYHLEDIVIENFIPFSTVVHRNVVTVLPPLFFQILAGDWVVHVLLAQQGPLGLIDEPWAIRRVHAGGVMSMKPRATKLALNLQWVRRIHAYFRHPYGTQVRARRAYLHRELALELQRHHRPWRAAWHAAMALGHGEPDQTSASPELLRMVLGNRLASVIRATGTTRARLRS